MISPIDVTILILYLLGIVILGCWIGRRSQSTEAFMAAERSLPGWVVGLSVFGTYISSISFLANPGKSYALNWNPFVFSLSLPLAAWISTRYFVPHYRRIGSISAYEHLEENFGSWARLYAMCCYLLTQIMRIGTILYLVAIAVEPLMGSVMPGGTERIIPSGTTDSSTEALKWLISLTGLIVILYTLIGGIEAVIWTDVIQSIVLSAGIFLSLGYLFWGMPEGPMQVFEIAQTHQKFSLGSLSSSLKEPTVWVVLIYGLTINLQNFGIDQSYVQRYITAKSDQDAKQSVWLGALLTIPVSALLFLVGTALFAYYQAQPELLPLVDGSSLKADKVFPYFIGHQLPVGTVGLLVAAILAAAMSSVDSSLNSSATLILNDVYRRYRTPNASEKQSMNVLRLTTIAMGCCGMAVAFAMIQVKNVLDAWWELAGIFSGGMLGLFLLGLCSERKAKRSQSFHQVRNLAAMVSVIFGLLVILYLTLPRLQLFQQFFQQHGTAFQSPLHSLLTSTCGTLSILVIGFLLTILLAGTSQEK